MIQPTIVEEQLSDNTVLVRYPNPKAEKSKTSRSFWKVKERNFPVENPQSMSLSKGDMVEILIDPVASIKAAFMVFILPLIGFLVFYAIAFLVTDIEIILFISGVTGLAAGMSVNILMRKIIGIGKLPVIHRKMTLEDMKEFMDCHAACKACKGCG
jgi:positive regulator of sigma E activity